MKAKSFLFVFSIILLLLNQRSGACADNEAGTGSLLFEESFEDTNFASRGWYDDPRGVLSDVEHIQGSTKSFECRFLQEAKGCYGGGPGGHSLTETDSVYVSFWIKHSSNWTGSNRPYHPHQFYLVTNQNDRLVGPAWTHLTAYIEENGGVPLLAIQDGQNIDKRKIGQDLVKVTENRSVAGCNGDSDGYGKGDCYRCFPEYCNGKQWKAGTILFCNDPGPYYKNDWHHIEAYFKLNSISNGKGVADGVVRYWFDNQLVIDQSDVMMRIARHPDMKFNQFILGPYIGNGSPIEQTFWIDNLTVATGRIDTKPPESIHR